MREIELTNARTADVTVAISDSERAALLDLDPALVVEVVPLVFELPRIAAGPAKERRGLFFVGGFWHTPNADAVIWFVKEIWPLILRQQADLVFRIAGSNAPADVLALAQRPGVEVVGFVPDLTELFDRSRVFVAPMRFGAGVKGKVGQSMAHGLPVVATSIGAEGMSVRDGEHLLVADAPGAFADAVLRLVGDDELWARLQANGRKFVEQTQSMAAARLKLAELLDG
jgi:glycosyltransferase involved in cell wall biosynthesis